MFKTFLCNTLLKALICTNLFLSYSTFAGQEPNTTLLLTSLSEYFEACNINKQPSSKVCQCKAWAENKDRSLPKLSSQLMTQDELNTFVENLSLYAKLQTCQIYAQFNLNNMDIPEHSPLAKLILEENKGKLFTPTIRGKAKPMNKSLGWKYQHLFPNAKQPNWERSVYEYQGRKPIGESFKLIPALSHYPTREYIYTEQGHKALVKKEEYWITEKEQCKFLLGDCIYREHGQIKKMVTAFKEGVWLYNEPQTSIKSRILKKVIYDAALYSNTAFK